MNSKRRQEIVKIVADKLSLSYEATLASFLRDDLIYAEMNIITSQGGTEEVALILKAYGLSRNEVPRDIIPWLNRIENWPPIGAMDHYDLNDFVSYIGCYYDGTPTKKLRKKDRYQIDPIL